MSSPASRVPTPLLTAPVDNGLHIRIMSPSAGVPPNLSYVMEPTSTVDDLKLKIQASLDARPALDQQKLIYRGKVLDGGAQLGPIVIGNAEREPSYTLHLVLKPANNAPMSSVPTVTNTGIDGRSESNRWSAQPQANPFAPPRLTPTSPITRTTTTASFRRGPNTITTTTTRIAASFSAGPGTTPLAQLTGLVPPLVATGSSQGQTAGPPQPGQSNIQLSPELADQLNEQIRNLLQSRTGDSGAGSGISRGDMSSNLHARSAASNSVRTHETLPEHLRIPGGADRSQPPSFFSTNVSSVGTSASQALPRSVSEILNQQDINSRPSGNLGDRRSGIFESSFQNSETQNGARTHLADLHTPLANHFYQPHLQAQPVLYLLRDPLGRPHSLIVPPNMHTPSSYSTIPSVPLQSQNINQGSSPSLHLPASFSSPVAATNVPPLDVNANITGPIIQQLDVLARNLEALTIRVQQAELRAAATNNNGAGLNGMNVQQLGERVRERAGHLWLAMKLAVFVFLFSGQGGWSRMLYLGSIAVLIFIWQTGLIRPIVEALNPPPPQGNARGGQNQPIQPNRPNQQPNPPAQPGNTDPIDPGHAAQIIIERHEGAPRRMFRAVENGVGLFIASLVPGLHERHVEAAERRDRELRRAREGAQQSEQPQSSGNEERAPVQPTGQAQQPVGQQPQDQDQLRRRNLSATVEDADDNARNMGVGA